VLSLVYLDLLSGGDGVRREIASWVDKSCGEWMRVSISGSLHTRSYIAVRVGSEARLTILQLRWGEYIISSQRGQSIL